ncbi:MAG: hypothetical protein VYC39_09750 [Myxococcota bacterium]|nr:hypothetical protein [Myxococcota bacterium]
MDGVLSGEELAGVAADFASELDLEEQLKPYRELYWSKPAEQRPTLFLEDLTGIPFLSKIAGIEAYQHRARVRAGDGDLFAAVGPKTEGYEEYCRDVLLLGSTELVHAEPVDGLMAVARACMSGQAFERLLERAREAGGFSVHPYMSIDDVWQLARLIKEETGVPVSVCGPPTPVLWIANDKSLLSELAVRTAGSDIISESRLSTIPEEMAEALVHLAQSHERVALKRTRCASAMGNKVFDSKTLLAWTKEQLHEQVVRFLTETEWEEDEPVITVVWEKAVCSPSTQLFLPPIGEGDVIFNGVFEQILEGEEQMFLGSRPSTLPAAVEAKLKRSSLAIAGALQHLGYTGVCSFDFLVLGNLCGDFEVRITECNGRWGGTSTPMNLVSRLIQGPRPCYRAQDFIHESLVGISFDEFLQRVGSKAFNATTQEGKFVFYNTGCLAKSGKFDVIAFADTPEETDAAILEELPKLLGL